MNLLCFRYALAPQLKILEGENQKISGVLCLWERWEEEHYANDWKSWLQSQQCPIVIAKLSGQQIENSIQRPVHFIRLSIEPTVKKLLENTKNSGHTRFAVPAFLKFKETYGEFVSQLQSNRMNIELDVEWERNPFSSEPFRGSISNLLKKHYQAGPDFIRTQIEQYLLKEQRKPC